MTTTYPRHLLLPPRSTATLGDVVLAAFDAAADVCAEPREASRLATRAVEHMLRHRRAPRARRHAETWAGAERRIA